jgi:hypothetical protein
MEDDYKAKLAKLIANADDILVITREDDNVFLSYSADLTEMEVLDMLALVTSEFYNIADEGNSNIH